MSRKKLFVGPINVMFKMENIADFGRGTLNLIFETCMMNQYPRTIMLVRCVLASFGLTLLIEPDVTLPTQLLLLSCQLDFYFSGFSCK